MSICLHEIILNMKYIGFDNIKFMHDNAYQIIQAKYGVCMHCLLIVRQTGAYFRPKYKLDYIRSFIAVYC